MRNAVIVALACVAFGARAEGPAGSLLQMRPRADVDDRPRAGARLRPLFLRTSDGASHFRTWRDGKLGVECEFVTASDGRSRCLPTPFRSAAYGEASCTRRIAVDCGTTYASTMYAGGRAEVRRPGATVRLATTYALEPSGECRATTGSTHAYRWLLDEVAPATFVAVGAERTPVGAGRVVLERALADDGSATYELYDRELRSRCHVADADDRRPRCVPDAPASPAHLAYADDACARPLAAFAPAVAAPTFVALWSEDTCPRPRTATYRVGEPWLGRVFRRGPDGRCAPQPRSPGVSYVSLARVPAEALEPFEELPPLGRIVQRRYRSRDGLTVAARALEDARFDGQRCSFERNPADGVWRCLPTTRADVYADAACTIPAAPEPGTRCGRSLPRQVRVVEGPRGTLVPVQPLLCGEAPIGVRALGPTPVLAHYHSWTGGCVVPNGAGRVYAVGERIDPSLFEPAEQVEGD